VVRLEALAIHRHRAQERALFGALLDEHRTPIGQIANDLGLVADVLPAAAVERDQTLRRLASFHAVNDAPRIRALVTYSEEACFVVAGRERLGHPLQPLASFSVPGMHERR